MPKYVSPNWGAIAELYKINKSATVPELARQLGKSPSTVRQMLIAYGVELRNTRKRRRA